MENNERMKVYINNPNSVKEVTDGVFMDIHGNIFVFNKDYHVKQYTEEFDLRIIGHKSDYETVIIDVENAYKTLFGDIGREEPKEKEIETPEEEPVEETASSELKSDKWIKQKYARYNYRRLKEAYLMAMNNVGTFKEISEATDVSVAIISEMLHKKIHVEFTDALDEENGFNKYKGRKRLDARTIEAIYIESTILGMSHHHIASRHGVSVSSVGKVINGDTQIAKKVIEDCIRSGRLDAARKKIEATRESEVTN